MNIQAQIDEHGVLKVSDPNLWGKKVTISFSAQENITTGNSEETDSLQPAQKWNLVSDSETRETDWEGIKAIAREADKLDFPRRTHEEIIRDLHELRG